jgi:hypothetical protein
MVFEATEGTMRQVTSRSLRQAVLATRIMADTYTAAVSAADLIPPASEGPPRPVVTTQRLRVYRAAQWDRATPAGRDASVA